MTVRSHPEVRFRAEEWRLAYRVALSILRVPDQADSSVACFATR